MTRREEIWNKAQTALFEKYGESPDISIVNRFLSEKKMLAHFGVAEYFYELAGICRESIEKYNEKLIAENTVSCCFTAYLLGASDMNPLPMHYYCKCKRVEWVDDLIQRVLKEHAEINKIRPPQMICGGRVFCYIVLN